MVAVFSVTLFTSAALLFLVQPMLAKFVLPLFGSTPAVWTAALLFFQTVLLGGYAYAHVSTTRLGVRRAAALHLGLLALAGLALPIGVPATAAAGADDSPVLSLLGLLAVSAGLPFFAVSSTAPLLQRWLAGTDHPDAGDPYFLYRASNLGSLVGLLAYPFALEPALTLVDQGRAWAAGYVLMAALIAACALLIWRALPAAVVGPAGDLTGIGLGALEAEGLSAGRRARWVALAFVPSSLVLGVTSFLTTDLAPIPLLWVVPLGLYLLTFVAAFSPGRSALGLHRVMVALLPAAALLGAIVLVIELRQPLWQLVLAHLGVFFVVGMVCHGRLAADRPASRHLTEFYLWVAVGGVLGGAFNALVAPVVFDSFLEYPLALVLACLLWPGLGRRRRTGGALSSRALDLAGPLVLGLAVGYVLRDIGGGDSTQRTALFAVAALALAWFALRPLRFALGVAALLVGGTYGMESTSDATLYQERNFFGVHEVTAEDGLNSLLHGTTVHGSQVLGSGGPPAPTTYYHRGSPIAQLLEGLPDREVLSRAGLIGLGTGTMACHARSGERWTFFEIDPKVERIARDPRLFTYLRDCAGEHDVVLGDARLSLGAAPRGGFGLIVADAFSSDAIPTHLITREALALYMSRLSPGGVLAFHISNRYLDLDPVLGALARDAGLTCRMGETDAVAVPVRDASSSSWVALARRPADLGAVGEDTRWRPCRRDPPDQLWTDDYSNVVSLLRRGS